MLSRAEAAAYRNQAFLLAAQLGLTPAAIALGIKPERIRQWNKRYGWHISAIREPANARDRDLAEASRRVTQPMEAFANLMAVEGDRTRAAMARTSRRAFEHADTVSDEALHELPRGVALEKHARVASIAHNWQSQNVNVGVQVNVPLPDQAERDEMRSIDAKLDEIAKRLR